MAFNTHDQVPDSPTNTFATLNPLPPSGGYLKQGNLQVQGGSNSNGRYTVPASLNLGTTGKWYWEVYVHTVGYECQLGMQDAFGENSSQLTGANAYSFYFYNGNWYSRGTANGLGVAYGSGSLISFFYDADALQISVYKDNNLQGSAQTVTASTYTPAVMYRESTGQSNLYVNFGQDARFAGAKSIIGSYSDANGIGQFYYQPPTGALALCTSNLPEPATDPINNESPDNYFKVVKYNGSSSTPLTVTGVGFKPDLTWLKSTNEGWTHGLFSSLNGIGAGSGYKYLASNTTGSETDLWGSIQFNSDGWSGVSSSHNGSFAHDFGHNGYSFVSWNWKAGGAPASDGVAMVDGTATTTAALKTAASATITPTRMSVNTKAGFSIVKYTSPNDSSDQTVPHGLATTPDWIITKNLNNVFNWDIYHSSVSNSGIFTNAAINSRSAYGTVNNNVFTTKNTFTHNSTNNYIAYCWHSVPGYSAFGSYTGNGTSDGPFVYLGFKPALVICKTFTYATTTNTSWAMFDNARDSNNVMNKVLYANKSAAEGKRGDGSNAATDIYIDFLSNGFKIRSNHTEHNSDQDSILYACWAEQPGKYSNAR